jgi:hypothetical protein
MTLETLSCEEIQDLLSGNKDISVKDLRELCREYLTSGLKQREGKLYRHEGEENDTIDLSSITTEEANDIEVTL